VPGELFYAAAGAAAAAATPVLTHFINNLTLLASIGLYKRGMHTRLAHVVLWGRRIRLASAVAVLFSGGGSKTSSRRKQKPARGPNRRLSPRDNQRALADIINGPFNDSARFSPVCV